MIRGQYSALTSQTRAHGAGLYIHMRRIHIDVILDSCPPLQPESVRTSSNAQPAALLLSLSSRHAGVDRHRYWLFNWSRRIDFAPFTWRDASAPGVLAGVQHKI